jgi:Icc-related predicted phosphoesterase
MRIVSLADTHLQHQGLEIPDGDVLVHAGDALQHGDLDELRRAVDFFGALPHRIKVFVAGNHEVCLEKRPNEARAIVEDAGFLYLEDSSAEIEGLLFYGAPWQPKFRIWAFGAKRGAELAAKWTKIPDGVDVLVTHGPPHGFGDRIEWNGAIRRVGCVDLAARVREVAPPLHLFGHIHQDAGVWVEGPTTYANVTTDEGTHPASVFDVIRTRPSERPAIRALPRRTPAP